MNIKLWLLLAGAAAAGAVIISKKLGSDNLGRHKFFKPKEESKPLGEGWKKRGENSTSANLEKQNKGRSKDVNELRGEVQDLIEKLWNKQREYLETEQEYRLYKNIFFEEGGILSYIQRLEGLCHYDMNNYNDINKFKMKAADQIMYGLYNSIAGKMKVSGKSFYVPGSFKISLEKKAFINNENINIEGVNDEENLRRLKMRVINRSSQLEENLKKLNLEPNNVFYKKLWEDSHKEIEEMLDYCLNLNTDVFSDVVELQADIKKRTEHLKRLFEGKILFKYYEDKSTTEMDRRDLFVLVDRGDSYPAILRDEGTLISKGRITRVKTEKLK